MRRKLLYIGAWLEGVEGWMGGGGGRVEGMEGWSGWRGGGRVAKLMMASPPKLLGTRPLPVYPRFQTLGIWLITWYIRQVVRKVSYNLRDHL